MKEYTSEFIRNIALVSHSGAGKTMLTEAFLHYTGVTTRLGKIEDGTTAGGCDGGTLRMERRPPCRCATGWGFFEVRRSSWSFQEAQAWISAI